MKEQAIASYHKESKRIGRQILDSGGNAFDAFVSMTFAEFVLGEGITSLSGPLEVLIYQKNSEKLLHLDACFNTPLKNSNNDKTGARVPGAPAGLESISKKFGNLSFEENIRPAIKLARKGFKINSLYSDLIKSNKKKLKKSEYGGETFFQNGKPLDVGEKIRLPKFADLLENLSKKGSDYMYEGEWAKKAQKEIKNQGGILTKKDFSHYGIKWRKPREIKYKGHKILSPSGRNFGGLSVLLCLKTLEKTDLYLNNKHYTKDAKLIKNLIEIERESENSVNKLSPNKLEKNKDIEKFIEKESEKISKKLSDKEQSKFLNVSNHSYNISIVDKEGNAITGTHSIQSEPWGEGIFVDGVPIASSGKTTPFSTSPGERELSALSMHIGLKNSNLSFTSGTFSSSLIPAEFQFLVNLLNYNMSAKKSAKSPRFGTSNIEVKGSNYVDKGVWMDRKISKRIIERMKEEGFKISQEGWIDTGLGSIIKINENGRMESSIAPV